MIHAWHQLMVFLFCFDIAFIVLVSAVAFIPQRWFERKGRR